MTTNSGLQPGSKEQFRFFKQLKTHLDSGSVSNFLVKHLQIGRSTAYKKMSGETSLTLTELSHLLSITNIPIQDVFKANSHELPFFADSIRKMPDNPIDYLANINNHLKMLIKKGEVEFVYISNDIPFFHLLQFPRLLALKLFIWSKTNWDLKMSEELFNPDILSTNFKGYEKVRKELHRTYLQYSGTEVWSLKCFDSLFEQIKYIINTLSIKNRKIIDLLLLEIKSLFIYLKDCSEHGIKFMIGKKDDAKPIQIYHNQIIDTVNMIYAKTPTIEVVYTMFDTPNYVHTNNVKVVSHARRWLDRVISHSQKLSKEGAHQRRRFFRLLEIRMEKSINEIESMLQMNYPV